MRKKGDGLEGHGHGKNVRVLGVAGFPLHSILPLGKREERRRVLDNTEEEGADAEGIGLGSFAGCR
ncbi:hypothetical protein MPNT_10164 [Candidatus Methylacidithermus pantelleriae]|uniref:Uncharacterized protein n=1 Tax=Candidatus Methylacidithermus pantelleriae TaxID=2744239 RepID=A0A8J2FR95_9BACT|nr:hypothetical protein MPNT_10164 [Candidatus Methylacidithermus pantelleriae]